MVFENQAPRRRAVATSSVPSSLYRKWGCYCNTTDSRMSVSQDWLGGCQAAGLPDCRTSQSVNHISLPSICDVTAQRTFRDSTLRAVQHYNITTLLTNGSHDGHALAWTSTVLLRLLYYAIPQHHLELQIAKLCLQLWASFALHSLHAIPYLEPYVLFFSIDQGLTVIHKIFNTYSFSSTNSYSSGKCICTFILLY